MGFKWKKEKIKLKDLYGKAEKGYQALHKQQAISKAKELQKLRKERLKVEGELNLKKLKEKEQKRIAKAKKGLGKNPTYKKPAKKKSSFSL